MLRNETNIAILLFALTPAQQAKARNWRTVSRLAAYKIQRKLRAQVEQTIAASGLPLLCSDESTQGSGSFGQKLRSAVQSVFKQGYDAVIVLGNDCPDIRPEHIDRVRQALQSGQQLLGHTEKHGVYMIGLQSQDFDGSAFETLPWQSSKLLPAICEYTGLGDGACQDLPVLVEVHQVHDIARCCLAALRQVWLHLLPPFQVFFTDLDALISANSQRRSLLRHYTLKAPPLSA